MATATNESPPAREFGMLKAEENSPPWPSEVAVFMREYLRLDKLVGEKRVYNLWQAL